MGISRAIALASMKRGAASEAVVACVKKRTKKDPFWTDSIEPEYFFENDLRKLKPYYFEYRTFAKQRWLGRSLLDVFRSEFRDRPAEYYIQAFKKEMITVDGAPVDAEHIVKNSQVICHKLHRHEPPISAEPIKILHEGNGMLVVCKPASVPVHPSGRYRYNTLIEILRNEHGYKHLSIINRLDRLTSGIVMLGLDSKKAEELHTRMMERDFNKTYVCRVAGEFPSEDELIVEKPLKAIEHKLGLVSVSPDGKEAKTIFKILFFDAKKNESVVEARPVTGRTHQIRVHLQSLGHPIINDHLYNNPIWSKYPSLEEADLKEVAEELMKTTFYDEVREWPEDADPKSLCPECESKQVDPDPTKLCIYLHAYKYAYDETEFITDLPSWAIKVE